MSSEGPPTETAPTQSPAPREVWDEEPKEYLAQDAEYMGPYKRIRKGCTDICMLVVFLALLACNIIWGVVLSTQRSDATYNTFVDENYLNYPTSCGLVKNTRRSLLAGPTHIAAGSLGPQGLTSMLLLWLPIAFGVSVGVGFLVIFLYSIWGVGMVYVSLAIAVALYVAIGVWLITLGSIIHAVISLVIAALILLMIFCNRGGIRHVGKLFQLSSRGLFRNMIIFAFSVVHALLAVGAFVPFGVLLWSALLSLKVNSNSVVDRVFDDYCMSGDKRVPCCVMYVPPAFIAYVIIWFISSIWTIFTLLEVRVFVIGGTMAQWYFAPSSEAVTCNANLGRTLKHAICNNFGSIAFAGAVMTLCNALRQLARKARDDGGILGCILACILMCIVRFIEWLTKLTTISVAVTGEHFLASGRTMWGLLGRAGMRSVSVYVLPEMVVRYLNLSAAHFMGSIAGVSWYFSLRATFDENQSLHYAMVLGVTVVLFAFMVLSFMMGILLDALHSVFLCYGFELDSGTPSRPEIHDVIANVPGVMDGPGTAYKNESGQMKKKEMKKGGGKPQRAPPAQEQ